MSALVAAEQGAVIPSPPLLALSNPVELLSEGVSLVSRPDDLNNIPNVLSREGRVIPYVFNQEQIIPLVDQRSSPDDQAYAKQFFDMLEIKEDFEGRDKDIVFENMISRVLFQCLLSGILGFVYNTYITEFSIYNQNPEDGTINTLVFELLNSTLCTDEQMSELANPGQFGEKCFMADDHKKHSEFINLLITSLKKENTLTPEFKSFLVVPPPVTTDDIGQHYETLLEMVMRLGTPSASQVSEAPESGNMRLRILKNVCEKIVALLSSLDIINNQLEGVYKIVTPIFNAGLDIAANNTTFAGRIKSLVILAAAYNSYGWLFAIIAPFAIPAGISVATGTVKGIGKIAMLPIKLIQRLGAGFGKKPGRDRPNRDPINKLICIGYTTKDLPGDAGILKIPYYISLNDILDLSYELQSWEFAKRSLLSTMTIGHGVFDLGDWQDDGLTIEKQRLLSATNPLVTLFGYIADEFTQITTLKDDSPPAAAPYDYDYINVISDQMLNVVANTMKDDNLIEFAQTEMMKTTIGVWLGFLHESVSDARSALLMLGKTIAITAAEAAERSNPLFRNDTESSNISDITESSESLSRGSSDSGSSGSSGSSINSRINSDNMTIIFTPQSPPLSRNVSSESESESEFSFKSTNSGTTDKTLKVNLVAIEEVEKVAVSVEASSAGEDVEAEAEAVKFLFSPAFISDSLKSGVRVEEILHELIAEQIAYTQEVAKLTNVKNSLDGGYRRKHSNMMSHKAAKMQNKLVSQHRTVNNQKVMQYMPDYDINQRKFVKGRKSKNYRNKKLKTKKRNKKQFKKRQTKKVLRKRRTTKKRYGMNKN